MTAALLDLSTLPDRTLDFLARQLELLAASDSAGAAVREEARERLAEVCAEIARSQGPDMTDNPKGGPRCGQTR